MVEKISELKDHLGADLLIVLIFKSDRLSYVSNVEEKRLIDLLRLAVQQLEEAREN